MQKIELAHTIVEIRNGVVWVILKENAELDVKEIREVIQASETVSEGKPYLLVTDARAHVTITSEGRKIAADKKEAPRLVANAVIINNLALRISANFFSKFNSPHFKFRIFDNEQKALMWLLEQNL